MIGVISALAMPGPNVWAEVDLLWDPPEQRVPAGSSVEIGLIARSNTGADQTVAAMDVVLTWDPAVLEIVGVNNNGDYYWFSSGFSKDSALDGLNDDCGDGVFCDTIECMVDDDCADGFSCNLDCYVDEDCAPGSACDPVTHLCATGLCPYTGSPFNDGDVKYTALALPGLPAIATPDGLLVATFEFIALAPTELTHVVIEPELGDYSVTRVYGADSPNQDVTGELGDAGVSVFTPATLSVGDIVLVPDKAAYVVVHGEIEGDETFGLTVMVEIVHRPGNAGTVVFTPAPPADIFRLDDPWPGEGTFTPYDTDTTGSETLNGSVDDNGDFEPAPITFIGLLTAFPVTASLDAEGIWDVTLSTAAGDSRWEGIATVLGHGTLRIVASGDCNADGWIDLSDFSSFQACFTGPIGPVEPPGYSVAADLGCSVFDGDEDGDIDLSDYAGFRNVMSGPG